MGGNSSSSFHLGLVAIMMSALTLFKQCRIKHKDLTPLYNWPLNVTQLKIKRVFI